jgi:CRISPR system Cascade subunit CasE
MILYLTKVECRLQKKMEFYFVKNGYEIHRSIMKSFPQVTENAREKFDVLYHVLQKDKAVEILIQSTQPWSRSEDGFKNRIQDYKITTREIPKKFYDFKKDELFQFRILANPAKKVFMNGKKNNSRVFLTNQEDQKKWFLKKGEQFGFEFFEDSLRIQKKEKFHHNKKEIFFQQVLFEGVIKVVDKEKFTNAFKKGIGSEKAFGCGMLLLKRIGDEV